MLRPISSALLRSTGFGQLSRGFHSSAVLCGKTVPFNLADIGEGITEVEVLRWFVKPGDVIKQFDPICEVESDKATAEITSRFDGKVLKLHYETGGMAIVGSPLVDLEVEGEGEEETEKEREVEKVEEKVEETKVETAAAVDVGDDKILAAPAVRRLLREHSLSPQSVRGIGTGKDGRVLKEDVLRFLESGGEKKGEVEKPKADAQQTMAGLNFAPISVDVEDGDTVEDIRGIRRTMVKTMTASLQIPHFGLRDEIYMDSLKALREELKSDFSADGLKLSYMPFMIKAASLSLSLYPVLNSMYDTAENKLVFKKSHNIGVAMDTPSGLVVPNIKSVQSLSLAEIAEQLNTLQAKGKEGKLGSEEMRGTTFSLSNIGAIGGIVGHPLINPPQVAIGAIGTIRRLPRFVSPTSTEIAESHLMEVCWSGDHRIVDGATMAGFNNSWKKLLENPQRILAGLK